MIPDHRLYQGSTLLGTITQLDMDMPWAFGTWTPTSAFAPYRALFERQYQIVESDGPWDELQVLGDRLVAELRLVPDEGEPPADWMLHVVGGEAWFRY